MSALKNDVHVIEERIGSDGAFRRRRPTGVPTASALIEEDD